MATSIVDQLQRLTEKQRGRGRLPTPATRESISESRSEGVPSADPLTSGLVSPWEEQAYTGETYYSFTSADGLFVMEYEDETEYIDDDGDGASFTVKHLDRTPT